MGVIDLFCLKDLPKPFLVIWGQARGCSVRATVVKGLSPDSPAPPTSYPWPLPGCLWALTGCLWTPTDCLGTPTSCPWTPTDCLGTPTGCLWTPTGCLWTPTGCLWTPTDCLWTPTDCLWTPTDHPEPPFHSRLTPPEPGSPLFSVEWIKPKGIVQRKVPKELRKLAGARPPRHRRPLIWACPWKAQGLFPR